MRKLCENYLKMDPKSLPKIIKKINKNHSKIDPRAQETPFGRPGAHFGSPGTHFGAKNANCSTSGGHFCKLVLQTEVYKFDNCDYFLETPWNHPENWSGNCPTNAYQRTPINKVVVRRSSRSEFNTI